MLVAVCIPSHCGRETKVAEDVVPFLLPLDEPELPSSSIKLPDPSRSTHSQPTLFRILLDTWYASYHSLLTLVKAPNPTLTVILVFLVYSLAFNIQVLLPQYTSLVLDWPFATVNGVLALKALVSSFLLFALPSFRIFFLEPTMSTAQIDLLISQGSLLASVVGMVGLGFSKSTGTFITSLCIFTASVGFGDSLCSYGTYSLPKGESLGNYYVRLGLIQTIAGLVGAPLLSGIFSLVLKSEVLPIGLPFWLCAAVFGLGVLGTGALKRWHEIGVRGGASMD
ncbi:hypothetical protein MMC12_007138 [Toensbergia leucococca]|nr:hypothetical protein [Toensbergia leucococca]